MCIFSGEVTTVSRTRIFGRHLPDGRQALIYSMSVDAPDEVAMVLPLPVARRTAAIEFFDLSAYPYLFDDLDAAFDRDLTLGMDTLEFLGTETLVVHEVGAYAASFVPTAGDFARLDPRFRMPDAVLRAVPHYADYGFAVFQLQPGSTDVHPMAFAFPSRDSRLYFPTRHFHGHDRVASLAGGLGPNAPVAHFDHEIYAQGPIDPGWDRSARYAESSVDLAKAKHLVGAGPLNRIAISGPRENVDLWSTI